MAAFSAGIVLAAFLDYDYGFVMAVVAVIGCLPALALHLRPTPSTTLPRLASVALVIALGFFGAWYASERHPLRDNRHFSHLVAEGAMVTGKVVSLRQSGSRTAATLAVDGVISDSLLHAASGQLLAYLTDGEDLRVGDRTVIGSRITPVPPPLNPGVFDYAAYLAGQHIYHQTYVDADAWEPVASLPGWSLRMIGERSREAWFASLTPFLREDNLAVAAALIMGKRDLLDPEVRSAYADTGAIHVLAVSGLHVGILALLVMQIMGVFLPARPRWFLVRSAVTIGVVWYFALITGLSASVQRAALMVSVVLLGKSLNRRNSIFNLLAISALLMLVIEPKQLFQVGFQLSFAAVAGIALFARRIQRMVQLPGKMHYIWDAISVSTAAQLGTLPFSLYYFGQFPVYFMLSGTLVIVFAYLVLGLGLAHGFLVLLGLPATWLTPTGTLLNWIVGVQNTFIYSCRQLPGATLELTSFGLLSAAGLLALIAVLAYLAYRPSHRGRWVAMGMVAILSAYWILSPAVRPTPSQFTVYHLPRRSLIDVYDGASGAAVGDTVPARVLNYQVEPARRSLDVEFGVPLAFEQDTSMASAAVAYPLLRLLDRRVLVLDGDLRYPENVERWPASDLVLVRKGFRPDAVPAALADQPIVVDGSNPPYLSDDWRAAFPQAHITAVDGAYRYVAE
ncbi:MAG: ComEC/Rec2 family competence protein [Lewinella sp.]